MAYCILCNKNFVSFRNLKIHEERLHQVCKKPNFICNFCNTGFEHFIYYQDHFSARLKRSMSKKSRTKNNFDAAENKRIKLNIDAQNNITDPNTISIAPDDFNEDSQQNKHDLSSIILDNNNIMPAINM